jgi:hypothetical protein
MVKPLVKPRWFRWGKLDPNCRYDFRANAGPFVLRVWPKAARSWEVQRTAYYIRLCIWRLEFEVWRGLPQF